MDYSQLSDFEINKRVCDVFWPDIKKSSECNNKTFPQNTATVYMKNGYGGFSRDYCHNPADAWPIIQTNGICIGYDGISWDASCHLYDIGQVSDWKNHPEKPLRMAMIVFLMIQDAKHA